MYRYRHCCSYSVLEGIETELTFLSTSCETLVPEHIIPADNLSTGVVFDNFDLFVDTPTGKDTLHDTVSIIYQNIPANVILITENASVQTTEVEETDPAENNNNSFSLNDSNKKQLNKSRKRNRHKFEEVSFELEHYAKKTKIEFSNPASVTQLSIIPKQLSNWKKIDIAWMITHFLGSDNVPMWVGYNSSILKDTSPIQKVSYLLPINASPIDNSVVWKTLKIANKISAECGTNISKKRVTLP